MPTCDDHYQSVENTTIKCQTKRDRGDNPVVTFFNEDNLFFLAFHDRPGEPSVAAPPTFKSARGASPAVEDLPGDGLRRAVRRCARPPPSPSSFSPLLGGDPVAPVFCACSSPTCAAASSPGLWTLSLFAHAPALCPQAFREIEIDSAAAAWSPRRRSVRPVVGCAACARRHRRGVLCCRLCCGRWPLGAQAAYPGGRAAEWWSGDACSGRPVAMTIVCRIHCVAAKPLETADRTCVS